MKPQIKHLLETIQMGTAEARKARNSELPLTRAELILWRLIVDVELLVSGLEKDT